MENRKLRIAITHGDTNGVGYEMIVKAFITPELLELCTPIFHKTFVFRIYCLAVFSFLAVDNKPQAANISCPLLALIVVKTP